MWLPNNSKFRYNYINSEIVNMFYYLGVVLTSGGSSFETQKILSGQALKAVFTLNKYLYNFNTLSPSHKIN